MNPFFMVMKMEIPHFMAFVKPMKIPLNIIWLNSWPWKIFHAHENSVKYYVI